MAASTLHSEVRKYATHSARILVVEDERIVAMSLRRQLQALGYKAVGEASSGEEAVQKTEELRPDLVLMDIRLEGEMDGVQAAAMIRERFHIPVVYLTAYSNKDIVERAKLTEPFGYILKPFEERELHVAIEMALHKHLMEQNLKEGSRLKDEFLAVLAHELANPLSAVRIAAESMQLQGQLAPELQWAGDLIVQQSQQMTRLIADLRDMSSIAADKLELCKKRIELAKVVRGAVEACRPFIERQGHELTVTLPPQPIFLDADPTRLAQVLQNLLINAAKYTDRGGHISLHAGLEGSDVVVVVRDTGIGIPAEKLLVIFEMFTKIEEGLSRSQGGLGIGLALAKRLVEMHGGSIEAHSDEAGCGSEFVVRLPSFVDKKLKRVER